MYEELIPNMMVEDVDASIAFYTQNLGFEMTQIVDADDGALWAEVQCENIHIFFQKKASLIAEYPTLTNAIIQPSLSYYFKTAEINVLYDKLKEKQEVVFIKDLSATEYGAQEFAIFDNNQNVLTFGE